MIESMTFLFKNITDVSEEKLKNAYNFYKDNLKTHCIRLTRFENDGKTGVMIYYKPPTTPRTMDIFYNGDLTYQEFISLLNVFNSNIETKHPELLDSIFMHFAFGDDEDTKTNSLLVAVISINKNKTIAVRDVFSKPTPDEASSFKFFMFREVMYTPNNTIIDYIDCDRLDKLIEEHLNELSPQSLPTNFKGNHPTINTLMFDDNDLF